MLFKNSYKYKGHLSPLGRLCKLIADMLPARVVFWVIIRAYVHTTTKECSDKTPDQVGFSDLIKSWEKLLK